MSNRLTKLKVRLLSRIVAICTLCFLVAFLPVAAFHPPTSAELRLPEHSRSEQVKQHQPNVGLCWDRP